MKNLTLIYLGTIAIILLTNGCATLPQQEMDESLVIKEQSAMTKDNPTILPQNVTDSLGDETSSIDGILNLDSLGNTGLIVRTYHLEENVNDTSSNGYFGYKVLEIDTMSNVTQDRFLDLLKDTDNYWDSEIGKRCEFLPNLGVEIVQGELKMNLLFAFSCDVVKIVDSNGEEENLHFDPGHIKFIQFGNSIFDDAFSFYLQSFVDGE